MRFKLTTAATVYVKKVRSSSIIPVPRDKPITIGRGIEADYQVIDRRVSRVHCKIEHGPDKLKVTDLGSANGTWIGPRRIDEGSAGPGDAIVVGDTTLHVEVVGQEAMELPEAPPPVPEAAPAPIVASAPTPVRPAAERAWVDLTPAQKKCAKCGAAFAPQRGGETLCAKCPDEWKGKTLGGCVLERRIAAGSASFVYTAQRKPKEMPKVVKVLDPTHASDEGARKGFLQAAEGAAKLEHENIVRTVSSGEEGGQPFVVMEDTPGATVETILAAKHVLDRDHALDVGLQVALALLAAQQAKHCHGNLVGEQVIVADDGSLRVAGFGGREWTPEGARLDLQSLGGLLTRLASGKSPGVSVTGSAPSIPSLLRGQPPEYVNLVTRLLSTASENPPTLVEFLLDAMSMLVPFRGLSGLPHSLRNPHEFEGLLPKEEVTEERLGDLLRARLAVAKPETVPGYGSACASLRGAAAARHILLTVKRPAGTLALVVAGEAPEGFRGALTTVLLRNVLRRLCHMGMPPTDALRKASDQVSERGKHALKIPALFTTLNPKTHSVTVAQAGLPGPLVWKAAGGVIQPYASTGTPLGDDPPKPALATDISLDPGDRLLLFAPGLLKADGGGAGMGMDRIGPALRKVKGTLQESLEGFLAGVAQHCGGTLPRDLAVIALERLAEGAK